MKVTRGKGAVKRDKNEVVKPVEDRAAGKRKAVLKASKSSNKRTKNVKSAKKDPNKPKRPPSAFFVFLEEFRKVYKQEHPNVKAVSAVGKAGGEKWKSLTDAEKAPFEAKAAKRKLDYEKLMTAYNKKQVGLNPFFFLLVWICFIPCSFRLLTGLEYIWIRKVLKMKMKRSLRNQNPRCMTTMMMKNLKRRMKRRRTTRFRSATGYSSFALSRKKSWTLYDHAVGLFCVLTIKEFNSSFCQLVM